MSTAICRWVSADVAVNYHTTMAGDQMVSVTAWVDIHAYDSIDHIDVYDTYISMCGRNSDQQDSVQVVIRSGDLTADLDEVYRRLRRLPPRSAGGVGTLDRNDVRVKVPLTAQEQGELDAWIKTRDSDEIGYVIIDAATVTIYRRRPHQVLGASALAVRYPGRLIGALDEAVAALRNTP